MASKIIQRKDALAQGLTEYFTGKPCIRGHIAKRWAINGSCAECVLEDQKADPWHKRHPEKHRESGQRWYYSEAGQERERRRVESGEHKRRSKERWDNLTHKEREVVREKRKQYYDEHRDEAIEYSAQWKRDNREQTRLWEAWSKAHKRAEEYGALGTFTIDDLKDILKRQKNCCVYCGRQFGNRIVHHLDHIMPFTLDGSNSKANIQWLCKKDSDRNGKGNKHPVDYAKEVGFKGRIPHGQTNKQYRALRK